jgi:hypothetical protein
MLPADALFTSSGELKLSRIEKMILSACLFLSAFVAAGCVRTPGGIAPSNIPLNQGAYTVIGRVAASDCKVNLFGILPVSGSNTVADAVEKALRREPQADALINISIDRATKFLILWSQVCTEIHATAVSVP